MGRTLYISDMDGTLLGSDSRISERSARILNGLADAGVFFTVATARTPATVVPLLSGIRTKAPAIVMTGSAMWDHTAGHFFNAHFVPAREVKRSLEIFDRHGVAPFVYVLSPDNTTLDVYHSTGNLNSAERAFYEERANLRLKRFHLGTPQPERALTRTILLYAMGPRAGIEAVAHSLQEDSECVIPCYPDIFNHEIYNMEVFPPGVTKAQAVMELKAAMGADRVVVFGDNLNDIPMLEAADVAVAVENAFDEVKAKADIIIEPNFTDSVARFVAKDAGLDYLTL